METLKVKRLHEDAILPTRGSEEAAGLDLYSIDDNVIEPSCRYLIHTGIAIAMDRGYYARVAPRSGLAVKHGIDTLAGVVDSDYRGEVGVVLLNNGNTPFKINKGDRIAQLVIEKIALPVVEEVDDLNNTSRGDGGYGSTGV